MKTDLNNVSNTEVGAFHAFLWDEFVNLFDEAKELESFGGGGLIEACLTLYPISKVSAEMVHELHTSVTPAPRMFEYEKMHELAELIRDFYLKFDTAPNEYQVIDMISTLIHEWNKETSSTKEEAHG